MALSWKISGEAGFGITTIGLNFTKLVARHGYSVWSYAEFPSLIRGGFTSYELSISKDKYRTFKPNLDIHICLKQDAYDRDKHRVCENTIVIYDKDIVKIDELIDAIYIGVPYKDIKAKHKASQVMVNTVSVGITMALFGWDLAPFELLIAEEFAKKGDDIVTFNKALAKEGWDFAKQALTETALCVKVQNAIQACLPGVEDSKYKAGEATSLVMTGNDAFALGSMVARIQSYCAYPMSPSSTVLSTLASWSKDNKLVVRHTEDEIAAINEALGFAFAGARSAVGTSGGGFALMVEALSYAGVAEIPIVTYLVQRPGPATGLPTWTGQGDLLFAVHAGHGEFMKIVVAPGDNEEMIELASQAYNMADVFQTPVIVVSDKLLGESYSSIDSAWFDEFAKSYKSDRGQIKNAVLTPYLRYKDSETGISDLLIPGCQKGVFWQANSYEHTEDSHTTEDADEARKQVEKRARKVRTYLSSSYYKLPKIYGDIKSSDVTFVSYGTNKHAILQAMLILGKSGLRTSFVHFTHIFPLNKQKVSALFDMAKVIIFVENGSVGQLQKLLSQEECLSKPYLSLLKYDGRPILPSEIIVYCNSKFPNNNL